ncbi:MAG TPA: response regulator [Terracidiphilus sp.]|nr:response regulator [Terracidiphilus sp.]
MADSLNPPHVLVVDDESIIADTFTMILNMNGARAEAAYSAEAALELALELKPDILISDIVMGGMSGVELAIRLSTNLPGCRLILISGQSANSDLPARTSAQGYRFEFLEKPITPQQLLSHIGLSAGLPVPEHKTIHA